MTTPTRKDAREALATLFGAISGTGKTTQKVIDGDPDGKLKGESPVIAVLSAGSARPNMIRGTAQANNEFRFTVLLMAAKDTSDVDDVLDTMEYDVADLIATVANRTAETGSTIAGKWAHIRYEDGFSVVSQSKPISGVVYMMEAVNLIVTVW